MGSNINQQQNFITEALKKGRLSIDNRLLNKPIYSYLIDTQASTGDTVEIVNTQSNNKQQTYKITSGESISSIIFDSNLEGLTNSKTILIGSETKGTQYITQKWIEDDGEGTKATVKVKGNDNSLSNKVEGSLVLLVNDNKGEQIKFFQLEGTSFEMNNPNVDEEFELLSTSDLKLIVGEHLSEGNQLELGVKITENTTDNYSDLSGTEEEFLSGSYEDIGFRNENNDPLKTLTTDTTIDGPNKVFKVSQKFKDHLIAAGNPKVKIKTSGKVYLNPNIFGSVFLDYRIYNKGTETQFIWKNIERHTSGNVDTYTLEVEVAANELNVGDKIYLQMKTAGNGQVNTVNDPAAYFEISFDDSSIERELVILNNQPKNSAWLVDKSTETSIIMKGRTKDDFLETISQVGDGGTLIIPLTPDDTIADGTLFSMPTGSSLTPQTNLQEFSTYMSQDSSGNYLINQELQEDKLMRFYTFKEVELGSEYQDEDGIIPGQYMLDVEQFYTMLSQTPNYNMDGSVSNSVIDLRKMNSYSVKNENGNTVKIMFTIGSRKPEAYRYLQLTWKDLVFLKKINLFRGTNSIDFKVLWEERIDNGNFNKNFTDWNFIYGWGFEVSGVIDFHIPWIGEHRFINHSFNETLTTGLTYTHSGVGSGDEAPFLFQSPRTIKGTDNYFTKVSFPISVGPVGGITDGSKNDIIKAFTGIDLGETQHNNIPYINTTGIGLNNTSFREVDGDDVPVPPWTQNSGYYNNEFFFWKGMGLAALIDVAVYWYYSKSNANTELSQESYNVSKEQLLKNSLSSFNGVDFITDWTTPESNGEIVEPSKSAADYFSFQSGGEGSKHLQLMPTTIENLEKLMGTGGYGSLSQLGSIEYNIVYEIPLLPSQVIGTMKATDPATAGVNILKSRAFFETTDVSGEHIILLDFGSNQTIDTQLFEYMGGGTIKVERFVDLGNKEIRKANDELGRALPTMEKPVIQRRRNKRTVEDRTILI